MSKRDKKRFIRTPWEAWIPTGSWTTNVLPYSGLKRRVGEYLECQVKVSATGAVDAVALQITLPTGIAVNQGRCLYTTVGGAKSLGQGTLIIAGGTPYPLMPLLLAGTVYVYYYQIAGGLILYGAVTNAAPVAIANGDTLEVSFSVPVVGWE